MDHAVARSRERPAVEIAIEPCEDVDEQAVAVLVACGAARFVQLFAGGIVDGQARCGLVLVEQSFAEQRRLVGVGLEHREFDARRAGIESEDGV